MAFPTHLNCAGQTRRSKSELLIELQLQTAGLSYEYEVRLGPWVPDFIVTYRGQKFIIEHLGMCHDTAYLARWQRKQQWYHDNGYGPYLFVIRETDRRIDLRDVQHVINQILAYDYPDQEYSVKPFQVTLTAFYDLRSKTPKKEDRCLAILIYNSDIPDDLHRIPRRFGNYRRNGDTVIVETVPHNNGSQISTNGKNKKRIRVFNGNGLYDLLHNLCYCPANDHRYVTARTSAAAHWVKTPTGWELVVNVNTPSEHWEFSDTRRTHKSKNDTADDTADDEETDEEMSEAVAKPPANTPESGKRLVAVAEVFVANSTTAQPLRDSLWELFERDEFSTPDLGKLRWMHRYEPQVAPIIAAVEQFGKVKLILKDREP